MENKITKLKATAYDIQRQLQLLTARLQEVNRAIIQAEAELQKNQQEPQ
jgi:hypothetical protein